MVVHVFHEVCIQKDDSLLTAKDITRIKTLILFRSQLNLFNSDDNVKQYFFLLNDIASIYHLDMNGSLD